MKMLNAWLSLKIATQLFLMLRSLTHIFASRTHFEKSFPMHASTISHSVFYMFCQENVWSLIAMHHTKIGI